MRFPAFVCVLCVGCSSDRLAVANGSLPPDAAAAAAEVPALPEGAPADADPFVTAAVGKEVAAKNDGEAREGKTFIADGWQLVQLTDGPNARILGFEPALLGESTEVLRVQMLSTIAREANTDNLVAIAMQSQAAEMREAAITALARIKSPRAQEALLRMITSDALLADADARHLIGPRLRPRDLDDPLALSMAQLLDNPNLDDTDKGQLAFSLALLSARDGMGLNAALSPDASARIAAARGLLGGAQ